ncbi:hypothetical protein ABMC88_03575 [Sulfitobacter sp. HNIBRBA2951]|uniref:hypothetical protein n=1 Tax=Sulfitobacter aquimarinus TaxID=3158557 RepID=UPI0032DF2077
MTIEIFFGSLAALLVVAAIVLVMTSQSGMNLISPGRQRGDKQSARERQKN